MTVGDSRIRLEPRRLHGRTVLPLTHPGAAQVWKIVIPTAQSNPSPRSHDGFESLYVLFEQMRLVLGDKDLVLEVGTWGERMHVRADPADGLPE